MFNLTEFDHVEKFTVYDAIEFLKNEKKMSLDIILLVLFCNVLNRREDTIAINVYGQVHGGYRYKITDKNKKILDGEWLGLESVYSWYNNPENPNYCNINYEFEDEEIQTLKTYFFDKNELMQFLGFHSAKYNQDEQQKDKITAHQNKGITNNNTPDEIARLNAIIEQQAKEITELKTEIENLKKPEMAQSIVNYDEFSIYGHTSENIKIAFEIIKKISEKCDPENPHSYPKKDDFIEYIRKYFTDNNSLAQSLYKIIIPEKVKGKGCPPKGVETFQGFI